MGTTTDLAAGERLLSWSEVSPVWRRELAWLPCEVAAAFLSCDSHGEGVGLWLSRRQGTGLSLLWGT